MSNPRFNASKHGVPAGKQIVSGETAEDLARLTAEYQVQFDPANAHERFLVNTLVHNEWLLRCLRRTETEIWDCTGSLLSAEESFSAAAAKFAALQQVVDSCEPIYHRALKELTRIQVSRAHGPRAAKQAKQRGSNVIPFRQKSPRPGWPYAIPHPKPWDKE